MIDAISSLGYVGFRVEDPAAWQRFATEILGLMPAGASGEMRRLRADQRAWRIELEEGPENDIAFAGFELSGPHMFEAMAERLASLDIAFEIAGAEQCRARGVLNLLLCHDPDGLPIELYFGPSEVQEEPFISPAGVSGFVTGEQGLGHIVLFTPDIERSRAFYQDALGFRLSDVISLPVGPGMILDLEFFHCNSRHHTLALAPAPVPKRLHHFMLETRHLDDVGLAMDRLIDAREPLAQSLGRHTNDHMVSFYAVTPGGFQVEYGWGARNVEEQCWNVVRHDKGSIWGHRHIKN